MDEWTFIEKAERELGLDDDYDYEEDFTPEQLELSLASAYALISIAKSLARLVDRGQ